MIYGYYIYKVIVYIYGYYIIDYMSPSGNQTLQSNIPHLYMKFHENLQLGRFCFLPTRLLGFAWSMCIPIRIPTIHSDDM